jgi:5-methylcytosine-specific restriction endonuclease McrA
MGAGAKLGTRLVAFEITPDEDAVDLYAPSRLRRAPITGVRDALSGYQDGRCAYCGTPFTDIGTSRVAVDRVLPFVLMSHGWHDGDLHQVWNLVLACYGCNSEKRDLPLDEDWMPWLDQRGEHLIASHHPLRETLISQLGPDTAHRHQTLRRRHTAATEMIQPWKPPHSSGQPLSPVSACPCIFHGSGDEDILPVPVEVFGGGSLSIIGKEQHLAQGRPSVVLPGQRVGLDGLGERAGEVDAQSPVYREHAGVEGQIVGGTCG